MEKGQAIIKPVINEVEDEYYDEEYEDDEVEESAKDIGLKAPVNAKNELNAKQK